MQARSAPPKEANGQQQAVGIFDTLSCEGAGEQAHHPHAPLRKARCLDLTQEARGVPLLKLRWTPSSLIHCGDDDEYVSQEAFPSESGPGWRRQALLCNPPLSLWGETRPLLERWEGGQPTL